MGKKRHQLDQNFLKLIALLDLLRKRPYQVFNSKSRIFQNKFAPTTTLRKTKGRQP
ncbi:protein of unknown function [Methylocaldum szegediense]|uniref:Transposase n=1 Tax=Methylocaldum szegediense TaxID=73780 RepID=A0ABN8XE85_9GAMM|nr:protein of unknown function [Methylocaldum szegediense]